MTQCTNDLGQPVGGPVTGWRPRSQPPRTPMRGRLCRVEPLDAQRHAESLHRAHTLDLEGRYVDEELTVGGPDGDTIIDPYGLGLNSDLFAGGTCTAWPPLDFPGSLSCIAPRPTGQNVGTQDDDFFVPKATLKWSPADNQMYYASWAMAAKPASNSVPI